MREGLTRSRHPRLPAWLLLALVAAAVLPLVVFIALQTGFSAQIERSNIEQAMVDRARRVITAVDARLERTRGAAGALVTTRSVLEADWPGAYQRAKEITDQNPDWDAVIIWDRSTRRELVNTGHPPRPPQDMGGLTFDVSAVRRPGDLLVGGTVVGGKRCPCVYVHTAAGPARPYILTVRLYADALRPPIEAQSGATLVTSLVDADGLTIARNVDHADRVGRPEAESVRAAARSGLSGIYEGDTLEGVRSVSAFAKSNLSGWSVHLARDPGAFEGAGRRWVAASAIAAFASLVVAAAIVVLALRAFAASRRIEQQATAALRAEAAAQLAVARDLHDGVLQFLTGLSLRLRKLREQVAGVRREPGETDSAFESLESEVRREQRELRRFIENLGPTLKSAEPMATVAATAAMLARRWAVEVEVSPEDADALIPNPLHRDVEFILREAVSNAVRHGAAHRIEVRFARTDAELTIEIEDDGSGFPASYVESGTSGEGGRMPATIHGRVIQHGGAMSLGHGRGAIVRVRLPVR